jgi:hypothetical protein
MRWRRKQQRRTGGHIGGKYIRINFVMVYRRRKNNYYRK